MSEWCANLTRQQALDMLEKVRIPAGPVHSPRQVLEDEVVHASGSFKWMSYPGAADDVPIVAPPVSMSRTPPEIRQRAPTSGEHTTEILSELGYTLEAIDNMRERGIV